jgi:signal transduction histidine kinase/CheY-like chemotaxis protein
MTAALPSQSPRPHAGARRLTFLYIVALSAVALLSLAGQAVVQLFLDRQMSDSAVINIAGRQRMLSQRIAKAAIAAGDVSDKVQQAARRNELAETLDLWERSHRGLQNGDAELGLPGANSPEVKHKFAALESSFQGMLAPAKRLCAPDRQTDEPKHARDDVAEILRHEQDFLAGMDTIVSQYAAEASRRVTQVKQFERGLLIVTIAVLLLEGLFVFRPAVRRIREMLAALEATGVKLAAARDAAEAASQAKSRFLAVTSHELRSPLHAVLGIAEQLQKTPLSESQRHAITVLHDAAKTQLVLVDDLLDLGSIDSGKLDLRTEIVCLDALVDQSLSLVRPDALEKGLELSADIDPNIPAAIVTDPLRLSQVLVNLLGNAIKFTDHGSVRLSIERLANDDKMVKLRFSVVDTGIGIPPAEQERIFESFTQVDASPARTRSGVGLGLAISRRLVELLNGKLELESEFGCGSRFSFALDCQVADASAAERSAERHDLRKAISATNGSIASCSASLCAAGPILVVDDGAANRYLAAAILRGAGYEVEVASSGAEALQAIAAKSFRAILLDIHMPGMDGLEVAQSVRRYEAEHNRCPTPIIGLTADAMPETAARLRDNFIDIVLHKPANEEAMLSAIAATSNPSPCAVEMTAAAGEPSDEVLTSHPLTRLRGDRSLLTELSSLFAVEASQQRARIEDGLRSADAPTVRQASHRLRGQAMIFDAVGLCQTLSEVEDHAAAGEIESCRESWISAAEQLDSLCQVLASGLQSPIGSA